MSAGCGFSSPYKTLRIYHFLSHNLWIRFQRTTTENKAGGKRERGKVKFPCKLCTGNHLTHHCPRMDEALRLLKESEDAHQQLPLTSPKPVSEQPLVD